MSIGVVDATLKVTGFKQLKAQAEKAGKSLAGINSKLEEASGGMKAMGAAGAVAFAGMALAANKAVKAFGVQVRAERSLEIAFKDLGEGAAGAAAEIIEYAAALQKVTTFGDEVTIQAAKFLRVQGMTTAQIKAALPVIQDFAAVTGMDLPKAAILAGRAMTGNVKVLERYLGSIDDAKAAQIDALGPAEKAIAVTALLTEKVGGQAALLRQSGVGAMEAYANSVGDLWEELGELIDQPVREFFEGSIESVEAMTSAIGNLQPWAKDLLVTVAKWAAVFTAAAAGIAAVALVIPQIVTGLGLMKAAWLALAPSIWAAVVPVLAFAAVLAALVLVIAGVRKTWHDFGSAFVYEATEMFNSVLDTVKGWAALVKKFFSRVMNGIVGMLRKAISKLGDLSAAMGFDSLAKTIKSFENISFEMDFGLVGDGANAAAGIAAKAFEGVAVAASSAGSSIGDAFAGAFSHVRSGFALLKKDITGAVFSPTVKAAGKASSSAGAGASAPGVANAGAALKAAGDAEVKARAANTAAFNAQSAVDLEALKSSGAKMVSSLEATADSFDRVEAAWAAGQAQAGTAIGSASQALQGNISGAVQPFIAGLGPVAGAVAGFGLALFDASEAGKKFKEGLGQVFQKLANLLSPIITSLMPLLGVLDALVPIIGIVIDTFMTFSFLKPTLKLLGWLLGGLAKIMTGVVVVLRSAWIGMLKFVESITLGLADFSSEIADLEAANRAAMNPAVEPVEELASAATSAAAALGTLNVPSGFKLARAAFNADQGRLTPPANDFISRPGMPVQRFSRADTLIGFDGGGPLGGGGGGGGSTTYDIGEVHIHGVDDPEDFWNKIKEATRFQVDRGGAALPLNSQFSGV